MKSLSILLGLIALLNGACNQSQLTGKTTGYEEKLITEANLTPTVDIRNYTLITNNFPHDSISAIEILRLKRNLPLAMQRKDSVLFDSILSIGFTYRGEDEFYKNRKDYIRNRVNARWTIDTVQYQNLVLQFFGEIAILTYRNTLNGTDDNNRPVIEHYSWADIYGKENGKWKIKGMHEIGSRVEYPK